MKRLLLTSLAVALAAGNAFAQNGNPCPGDKEYQFNIIATKDKIPPMTGNNGHRIFVPLTPKTTKIYMTGDTDTLNGTTNGVLNCGNKFDVLDANGTDGTAILLVPCDALTADNLNPSVCFDVYATPLGTPGPAPNITVHCEFDSTCVGCNLDAGDCATGTIITDLVGHNGKPKTTDISKYFRASGCLDLDANGCDAGDINFNNEWIFNIPALESYYWDYDANGNRITQIRFCDVEGVAGSNCGPNTIVL